MLLDTDDNARELAGSTRPVILAGAVPRLVDEWQIEPRVWNHVRRAVDDRRSPGHFILVITTGNDAYQCPDGVTIVPLTMLGP